MLASRNATFVSIAITVVTSSREKDPAAFLGRLLSREGEPGARNVRVLQKSESAKDCVESFSERPGWKICEQFDIASARDVVSLYRHLRPIQSIKVTRHPAVQSDFAEPAPSAFMESGRNARQRVVIRMSTIRTISSECSRLRPRLHAWSSG